MKILIVSDAWLPQVNGVVRVYEYLAAELAAAGHDIRIIGPADFPRRMPMPGYREIELALFPYAQLARMIDEAAPDTLHIATEGPLGHAARRYALKRRRPFTTAYHSQFPDYAAKRAARLFPALEKPVRAAFDRFIRRFHAPSSGMMTTTHSLQEELTQRGFRVPMHRVTLGVDFDLFRPGRDALFAHLTPPVALYVGRIAVEKNLEGFLSMDWHGTKVVVGHGPDMDMLQKKYPDVLFTGKKTGADLAAHYRSSDVFVFPSRTDTFGMVLIEALACGLPVAAHDVIGPRDIITAPHLGTLHEDLSHAARTALEHGAKREDRHSHARDLYNWKLAAADFVELCRKAMLR